MRPDTNGLDRLFVYGIFLGEYTRQRYGMSHPRYAVVRDFVTVRKYSDIVEAVPLKGAALTGLLVKVDPSYWHQIDDLEYGYDRIKVGLINGPEAWMYVRPEN